MRVQLSVELNGSLVGDSPYLVVFEVDDDPPEQDNENANFMPVGKVRFSILCSPTLHESHMSCTFQQVDCAAAMADEVVS